MKPRTVTGWRSKEIARTLDRVAQAEHELTDRGAESSRLVRVIAIQEVYVGGRKLKIGEHVELQLLDGGELPRWCVLDVERSCPGRTRRIADALPWSQRRRAASSRRDEETAELEFTQ